MMPKERTNIIRNLNNNLLSGNEIGETVNYKGKVYKFKYSNQYTERKGKRFRKVMGLIEMSF